ncbi:MAG TPA: efflux RND transporter periplasmic adaptor subunit [Desulfobacterales bacterium]|nr:efflux RND transporter periplasmic adaptor subunit [Desulfobacterales bacterium]
MKKIVHVVLVICIVAIGLGGFLKLTASKPRVKRKRPKLPLPVVRAIKVRVGPHQMIIKGQGTVRPIREISLVPEVGGRVVYLSPALVDGGEFRKGELLVKIDPVDYELAVTLAKSKVREAQSSLDLLREESEEARSEWEMNHREDPALAKHPPPLLVKEPQIAAAEAQLEAAKANLKKTYLDLKRTELVAPFGGRVTSEKVGIGQYVKPGQVLAKVYSTESVEISVPLERESIQWFDVPGLSSGNGPGSRATISASFGGKTMTWHGRVSRSSGKIDERTRMINVIVRVDRPYETRPPLAIGLFVDVSIKGKTIQHVAEIPSWAFRNLNQVWVVEGRKLVFRRVKVVRLERDVALVTEGLNDGDLLVVSHHRVVTNGMKVRVEMVPKGEAG